MAGLREREANGDLVELLEELVLLHPELPFLELREQLGHIRGVQQAPPFAPGQKLTSVEPPPQH